MRYQLVKQLQGYSRQSVLMAGGCFLMGALGWATPVLASVPTITDGTSIFVDGPFGVSATTSPNGMDYTNGVLSQSLATPTDLGWIGASSATTSLTNNELSLNLQSTGALNTGSFGDASAEMWDTLIFGGSVNANTVNANTVLGTLNMAVTASMTGLNSANYGGYGLGLYDPSTFSQPAAGGISDDCVFAYCGGLVTSSFDNAAVSGNSIISVPITWASLHNGQVAYITEIYGTPFDSQSSLVMDPSVTITGLYPGVTVSSLSGTNYVSTVEETLTTVLLGGGALLMGLLAFRKKSVSALQFSM